MTCPAATTGPTGRLEAVPVSTSAVESARWPATAATRPPPGCSSSLRTLLGDELSEFLGSGESGPDRGPKDAKSRSRLLRDLRMDTRSRAAWTRLLNDYPNPRKYKGIHKKGLSKGCFGLKLDRIGAMSGLGC
ncbi:hypothetical protein NDU88_000497 [Pleurodeles waltl]|uniref:C-type natriuretic peptide n=1 Tax=Pleurodeles waltl TaxID=8319 RepID=A0AAV7LAB8_PLEWA|nr:hypothetical protein NDU88_000497 [Pleurodeles waltl]